MEDSYPGCPDDPLFALGNAGTSCEELAALQALEDRLSAPTRYRDNELRVEDLEEEWLSRAMATLGDEQGEGNCQNPFPGFKPQMLLADQLRLNRFTYYLFERRFGWSEALNDDDDDGDGGSGDNQVVLGSPHSLPPEGDIKSKLNDLLDKFLKWYLNQNLCEPLLLALENTVLQASSKPVVRNQAVVHTMDWLKSEAGGWQRLGLTGFQLVQRLVLLGLTDIWSAVRNTCATRLGPVLQRFGLDQIQQLFTLLTEVCLNKNSGWQSLDGALIGINCIIRRFQWIGHDYSTEEIDSYCLKFGHEEFSSLPEFIKSKISAIVYPLLSHPQLSIRENAIKVFSSYISRCEFREGLSYFQQVIRWLCEGADQVLPHLSVFRQDYKFLNAYLAEGLLGVAVFLIKHMPSGYLLPDWPRYLSTFSLYLMHPASTVRQATSAVFKYLVAKDTNNPSLMKLVLQGLAADWTVNLSHVVSAAPSGPPPPTANHNTASSSKSRRLSITHVTQTNQDKVGDDILSETWEWREGRLFAYELILRLLISNHIHYLFPSYALPSPKFDGAVSTDETLTSSHQSRVNEYKHGDLQKSLSHGGTSLKKVFLAQRNKNLSLNESENILPEDVSQLPMTVAEQQDQAAQAPPTPNTVYSTSRVAPEAGRNYGRHASEPVMGAPAHQQQKRLSTDRCQSSSSSLATPTGRKLSTGRRLSTDRRLSAEDCPSRRLSSENSDTIAEIISEDAETLVRTNSAGKNDKPRAIQTLQERRSFTHAEGSNMFSSQIKSSSYYTNPNAPFRPSKLKPFGQAASLLSQTSNIDQKRFKGGVSDGDKALLPRVVLRSPVLAEGSPISKMPSYEAAILKSCLAPNSSMRPATDGPAVPEWLDRVQCDTMASILSNMFFQTVECLADSRWELRRMGQQLLPLITECIRWYSASILRDLWNSHLRPEPGPLCYGLCLALRYSLLHAERLHSFLDKPQATWKDPEGCRHTANSIVSEIRGGLRAWVPVLHQLVEKSPVDKLMVVAMETLMLSHSHFSDMCPQKWDEERSIVGAFQHLFVNAHGSHPLCAEFTNSITTPRKPFLPTTEGFLACCNKESGGIDSMAKCAQQAEKHTLGALHSCLPAFLKTCRLTNIAALLPVMTHHAGYYCESTNIFKSLLQGLLAMLQMIAEAGEVTINSDKWLGLAINEVSNTILHRNMELSQTRQVLEICFIMCTYCLGSQHLRPLFQAVTSRLDLAVSFSSDDDSALLGEAATDSLAFLSNDIPTSPVQEQLIYDSDSDEEDGSANRRDQGLMLNASGGSNQLALSSTPSEGGGGVVRVVSPTTLEPAQDDDSDWDSWDEEEEDQTALSDLFAEFLNKLQMLYSRPSQPGHYSVFYEELIKSGERERKLVNSLLDRL